MQTNAQIIATQLDPKIGWEEAFNSKSKGLKFEWEGPVDGIAGVRFEYFEYLPLMPWNLEEVARDDILGVAYFKRKLEENDGRGSVQTTGDQS